MFNLLKRPTCLSGLPGAGGIICGVLAHVTNVLFFCFFVFFFYFLLGTFSKVQKDRGSSIAGSHIPTHLDLTVVDILPHFALSFSFWSSLE